MNPKALRRLAADHGALHNQPLPPNYLFPPTESTGDDLTDLDILLAGPTHTPYAAGVWKLHLTIPQEYPQHPPTAHFRTPIFHPNVDAQTGGVCVETLKRDWESKLTLRDVLVTISCLLIQPNPDSALNAEAGGLIQDKYEAFARRAELMTSIHAAVPKELREVVREAQERGQEKTQVQKQQTQTQTAVAEDSKGEPLDHPRAMSPPRKRRATARQRGMVASRRSEGSPSGAAGRRRYQAGPSQPSFVVQTRNDDVFGAAHNQLQADEHDDSSTMDADQENDNAKTPLQTETPTAGTPRRPHGIAVPLGEMEVDRDVAESDEDDMEMEMEMEYPPSPRKSPRKSPGKLRKSEQQQTDETHQPHTSSRAVVAGRAPHITPPNRPDLQPLAEDSPFAGPRTSPRKVQLRPANGRAPLFAGGAAVSTPVTFARVAKAKSPTTLEKKSDEARRRLELNSKLWDLCGRDIRRWNAGDFDSDVFKVKAKRW